MAKMKSLIYYINEGINSKYVIIKRDSETFTAYYGLFDNLLKRFSLVLQNAKKESPLVKFNDSKTIKGLIYNLNKAAYETRRYQTSYELGTEEDLKYYKVIEC